MRYTIRGWLCLLCVCVHKEGINAEHFCVYARAVTLCVLLSETLPYTLLVVVSSLCFNFHFSSSLFIRNAFLFHLFLYNTAVACSTPKKTPHIYSYAVRFVLVCSAMSV